MKTNELEKMKYKLWYDKGYDYKFLNILLMEEKYWNKGMFYPTKVLYDKLLKVGLNN